MTPTTHSPTHILGVDPGLSGALCLYEISSRYIWVYDMPVTDGRVDPSKLADTVNAACFAAGVSCMTQVHGAIENVSGMPRQRGAFNFGVSVGAVHGVFGALGIQYSLVSPSEWKGAMGLRRLANETQDQNKTRARELAMELWPGYATAFCRVKDDGRAEACLIARFFANKKGWG